jgi:hypothetical protein
MRWWVAAPLAASIGFGCAQARQPEGGPPIVTPPRVVAVTPAAYSVLTDLTRPVVIRFDERLSERLEGVQDIHDAVLVSPRTGEVQVRRRGRELRVSMVGGWQPDLVYRIVVLPVLRDLFNNVREEPIDLVFSTGAPIPETAVAGFAEERLTGNPARGARVHATRAGDPHTYMAVTDTAGFFALREVPPGDYRVRAWLDQNRNRVPDFAEPQDSAILSLTAGDTVVVEARLLPGDTTPARLVRAAIVDSTKLELAFDDYFEPGPTPGTGRIYRTQDSTFVAYGDLVHATRLDSLRTLDRLAEEAATAAAAAAADTLPAAADTLPAAADTIPATPGVPPPADRRRPAPAQRQPLPARELILVLPGPLVPETEYFVVVEDVTNIHGVPGGGGSAPFRTPRRPPDPAPPEADQPPPDDSPQPPPDGDRPLADRARP